MQANWSLILNVLLLIGVVVAIGRMMKARRQSFVATAPQQPALGKVDNKSFDDIIAVRKLPRDFAPEDDMDTGDLPEIKMAAKKPDLAPQISAETKEDSFKVERNEPGQSVMIFLLARENRQLAGYDLLQTLLAAGLRFGDGQLFHRHQHPNGQGPVLFSLASATTSGVFDLQNIGAFSVRGLCLFMQSSGNATIDNERLTILFETAKQLSEDLDAELLDAKQRPLTREGILRYYRLLNCSEPVERKEMA